MDQEVLLLVLKWVENALSIIQKASNDSLMVKRLNGAAIRPAGIKSTVLGTRNGLNQKLL